MKLAIYHTSDLHGYMYPTNYVTEQPIGLLRIGTFMKEDEKNYDASLKVDCGDLIQGSALANYLTTTRPEPNPLLGELEAIGYDAYTIGNHEFNYGVDYFASAYKEVQDNIVSANITGLPFPIKPYKIFDFDGYKVAVIGLTTSYIPNWEQPKNIPGMDFLNPVEQYGKYEAEMKEQADFIIVAYHGGFEKSIDDDMTPTEKLTKENQGSELIETFDSIDLILSGHQHRGFAATIRDVVCMQPNSNGINFSKVVLDTTTGKMEYELIQTKDLPSEINPQLESVFTSVSAELEAHLDQVIGRLSEDIVLENHFDARLKGHPFVNFLHKVQLESTGADISVVSLFDTAIGFHKDVTMREVLINYPYANSMKVLELSGAKVKEAMEKSATYFILENDAVTVNPTFLLPKLQHYNYDMYGGVEYELDLTKPFGERVVSMKKDGKEIQPEDKFKVVLSNYRASNVSVYPCYENATVVQDIATDISDILIEYFATHDEIMVDHQVNYRI